MNLRLREIEPQAYVDKILPHTFELWSGGRSYETYVAQNLEIARSGYGRRYYATFGVWRNGDEPVASFKRYERRARAGRHQLRAVGFGGIFTREDQRGKGYASAMVGLALDAARNEGFDVAYLFSDIHPHFYEQLGFRELPSRSFSLRSASLEVSRIEPHALNDEQWRGVRRCFEACERSRAFGFSRSPLVWEWIRTKLRQRSAYTGLQPVYLTLRDERSVRAYVLGRREVDADAFVVDEFAYADDSAADAIEPMLASAAGDLRRITGWLPLLPQRNVLRRASVRRRTAAIFMIASLSRAGARFFELASHAGPADSVWNLDHV